MQTVYAFLSGKRQTTTSYWLYCDNLMIIKQIKTDKYIQKEKKNMFNFISFGSGSSGNCYYLYTEKDAIVIDTGIGIRQIKKYFANYGLSLQSIHHILVTHDHIDHIKSVGSLSTQLNIPVYASEKVHKSMLGNNFIKKKIEADNRRIIEANQSYHIGDFDVTTVQVPHDSSDNIGYCIVYQDITFCLMTDIGHVTEEMAQFISRANYLVIEANHDKELLQNGPYPKDLKIRVGGPNGHLSNKDCGEAIAQYANEKLKRVWLCHLSQDNNRPDIAVGTVKKLLKEAGGFKEVISVEALRRKIPSEIIKLI